MAVEGRAVAREVEPGGLRVCIRAPEPRHPVVVQHAEVPDERLPITRTSRPRNDVASLNSEEWMTVPAKPSRPGQSGITGFRSYPVATTTSGEAKPPRDVSTDHSSRSRSTRRASLFGSTRSP